MAWGWIWMAKIVKDEAEQDSADVQKVFGTLLGVMAFVEWWGGGEAD